MLQTLLVLCKRIPKKEDCKLLVIGTSSCADKLSILDVPRSFNVKINVPQLSSEEISYVLHKHMGVSKGFPKRSARNSRGFPSRSCCRSGTWPRERAWTGGPESTMSSGTYELLIGQQHHIIKESSICSSYLIVIDSSLVIK